MTRYIDAFGRETLIEISNQVWSKKIHFIIRKERQSVAEAIDIETAESIMHDLSIAIREAQLDKEARNDSNKR